MLEAAYGEIVISLHRGCLGDVAREEWLGCRHDASSMVDIPGSTPVWTQYMYFLFLIQNLYVLCFQRSIYIYYERTLVVPDVVLAR